MLNAGRSTTAYSICLVASVSLSLVGVPVPVCAQDSLPPPGSYATPSLRVTGRLVDASHFPKIASIVNPKVVLLRTPYATVGDSTGHFTLTGHLPPGCYELRVQAKGYRTVFESVFIPPAGLGTEYMFGRLLTLPSPSVYVEPPPPPCKTSGK